MMAGKINPTHCETLTVQVIGNHTTVTLAGAQGHPELNALKPVITYNVLQSIGLPGEVVIGLPRIAWRASAQIASGLTI